MSRLSDIKKVIIGFLITIVALILGSTVVKAIPPLSTGSSITVGYANTKHNTYKLCGSKWLYCVDNGASLSSYTTNRYTVQDVIKIVGNQATNGSSVITNSSNAVLAHILSHGEGYGASEENKSATQWALYKYWNTWLSNVGYRLGIFRIFANQGGLISKFNLPECN